MRNLSVLGNYFMYRSFCSNKSNVFVYNWRNKTKEILKCNKPLTWYICGPTVYDSMHIGHARLVYVLYWYKYVLSINFQQIFVCSCYVKFDVIRRILENYFQLPVFQVMNITDVDDKIISKAHALNKDPIQMAR